LKGNKDYLYNVASIELISLNLIEYEILVDPDLSMEVQYAQFFWLIQWID